MYVPSEDMKINKFKVVAIPRPKEYMRRFGELRAPAGQYTGDELARSSMNKVDELAMAEAYDRMMEKEELAKQQNDG